MQHNAQTRKDMSNAKGSLFHQIRGICSEPPAQLASCLAVIIVTCIFMSEIMSCNDF